MTDLRQFDYVIAGGGSAGCVLAARLAEDPGVSVLLIEAGGSGRSFLTRMPVALCMVQGYPAYNWAYSSVPQPGLGGRTISYPRGRGLGGSSLINGMVYIRGHRCDFDRWAAGGLEGWSYADVLPYFRRSAAAVHRPDDPFHSTDGRVQTTPACNFNDLDQMFLTAAQEAGAPASRDFNGITQAGAGRLDLTVWGGERSSVARAYLAAPPPNLHLLTGTRATRVLVQDGRAIGVDTTAGRITARREVILSLGAFETPKLLMLSGIGPAAHLRDNGIEVLRDVPSVGQSLADHPNVPVTFELLDRRQSFARYQQPARALAMGARWALTRRGPATGPFWSAALFHAFDGGDVPDLQVFFMSLYLQAQGTGSRADRLRRLLAQVVSQGKVARPGAQFDINLLRPHSVGSVTLASPDPRDPPRIDSGFLSDGRDVQSFVRGLRHVRRIAGQPAMQGRVGAEIFPGAAEDPEAYVRQSVITGHHPACTARMGAATDPGAVLDGAFRLRGIDRLRVVDASALPDMIGGNIHASVVMMAERAADMIRGRPQLPAMNPPDEASAAAHRPRPAKPRPSFPR